MPSVPLLLPERSCSSVKQFVDTLVKFAELHLTTGQVTAALDWLVLERGDRPGLHLEGVGEEVDHPAMIHPDLALA